MKSDALVLLLTKDDLSRQKEGITKKSHASLENTKGKSKQHSKPATSRETRNRNLRYIRLELTEWFS